MQHTKQGKKRKSARKRKVRWARDSQQLLHKLKFPRLTLSKIRKTQMISRRKLKMRKTTIEMTRLIAMLHLKKTRMISCLNEQTRLKKKLWLAE